MFPDNLYRSSRLLKNGVNIWHNCPFVHILGRSDRFSHRFYLLKMERHIRSQHHIDHQSSKFLQKIWNFVTFSAIQISWNVLLWRIISKKRILDFEKFNFRQKILFWTKNFIFDEKFYFWRKIWFLIKKLLTKISIFAQNFDFWQKFNFRLASKKVNLEFFCRKSHQNINIRIL